MMASRRGMSGGGVRLTVLLLIFTTLAPLALGESAGSVDFSNDSLSFSPSSPSEGEDVTVTATLTNSATVQINGVEVSLHPNSDQNTAFHSETVSISASGFIQVQGVWSDIPYGTQTVVLVVTHSGNTSAVSKSVEVSGMTDLVASNLQLVPTTDLHQGDVIDISVDVTNLGNADAPSSHLLIQLNGGALSELAVAPLPAGLSTTIQTSFNAPAAGNHQISAVANSASDGIIESDSDNNAATPVSFTVLSDPDYLHHQQPDPVIEVSSPPDSLTGPWTLSGEILRMGGSGDSTITVGVYLKSGENEISVNSFPLTFSETDPIQSWQKEVTMAQLPQLDAGVHTLIVRIDPSRQIPQSIQFNDDLTTQITIHPEPNVVVSQHASASSDTVLAGESVSFEVTVINTGTIAVIGDLSATFGGNPLKSLLGVGIPASEERTFTFSATVSGESEGVQQFISTWQANSASYDSSTDDNIAFGSVTIRSDLEIRFIAESEAWTPADTPLVVGTTYTYTISLVTVAGEGDETFTCLDHRRGEIISTQNLVFASGGENTVICTFTPDRAGVFELYVVPTGSSVATWQTSWSISATANSAPQNDGGSAIGTTILFIVAALLLIAVLVAAFVLSRVGDEVVERETFEYCPSCDGEIEGDEEICPYCDLDLAEGLSQFHDCKRCKSNIPDMMDHCPYCGTAQDISSYYEKREQREIVAVEERVEEEDDEDEIVVGTDDYGDAIQEMGYDEEQLESEWEVSLGQAESEMDEVIAERERAAALSEEEADEEIVISEMRREHEAKRVDIDTIIGDKDSRRHLSDEDVELTASDADIRKDIYELTGEEGILPGQSVEVEFIPDSTAVGNELKKAEKVTDFSFQNGEDAPPARITDETQNPADGDSNGDSKPRRRKRR